MIATLPAEFATEATAIDDARKAAYEALSVANERGVTGDDLDAMSTAIEQIEIRCEALRRRHFPRRHKLVVTLGAAMTMSKTGRRCEIVWQRDKAGDQL